MKKNIFIAIFASIIVIFIISFIPSLSRLITDFNYLNISIPVLIILPLLFLLCPYIGIKKLCKFVIPWLIAIEIILLCAAAGLGAISSGWGALPFVPPICFCFAMIVFILIYIFSLKLFEYLENHFKYKIILLTAISIFMLFVSWNNATDFVADYETDFIIWRIHNNEEVCIKRQEKYGVPFDMLVKTCDEDYEVKVSKKVCEKLVNNKYNNAKNAGQYGYLDDAIVKSVNNDGNELTKKSCKGTNWIEFNIIPNADKVKKYYNPKKVNKVDYMNYKGKIRTIQDVSIDMDMPLTKEERQRQNEKALKRLNNMNNNSNNSNNDYSTFILNF